jgi:DNA segregation ATPase FtsK/SpoIIIE, S-DNA-T family
MSPKPGQNTKKTTKQTKASKTSGKAKSSVSRAPAAKRRSTRGKAPKTAARKPALLKKLRFSNPFKGKVRGSSSKSSAGATSRPLSTGLSLDRKLDILGIGLLLVGLLTFLSLVSVSNSTATGSWLTFLAAAFGWGAYLFPVGMISIGVWLVLRNFEKIPRLSIERLLGIILLYTNLLVFLHFILLPDGRAQVFELASEGAGGGYVGGSIFYFLQEYLGLVGLAIVLAAWVLIGLAFTLDKTVLELFSWIPPLVLRVQDRWDEHWNNVAEREGGRSLMTQSPVADKNPGVNSSAAISQEEGRGAAEHPFYSPIQKTGQSWRLPDREEILDQGGEVIYDDDLDRQRARIVEETLGSFGAPVKVVEINRGPTITQFGVEPDFLITKTGRTRVRVGKIASLADDLALALSARRIRVEAPVPGRGYVGIEVPNDQIALVGLKDVIESEAFQRLKSPLRFALGQDVAGNAVAADLSAMPHLLIAGQTGSGKSVCVNTLITCLLLNNTPDDLRMVMVDPKRVELTGYNGIPHLLAPVVVETERVVGALQWVLREMDMRYHKLADLGTRNIIEYNDRMVSSGAKKLPYLVVIIDELADLMMLAPDETERTITRLAQLARATGIHLVIATQRPSVDVVTGLIKANFPARIAFAVAAGVDSRVILDQPGAERLLGRGDMLFQAPDAPAPLRLQGAYVSEPEIQKLVHHWTGFSDHAQTAPMAAGGIVDSIPAGIPLKQMPLWDAPKDDGDPLTNEAIDLVRRQGRASISMLQRRLRIGYTRAARLIEAMQDKGIIGTESTGSQGFEILDYGPAAPPIEEQGD